MSVGSPSAADDLGRPRSLHGQHRVRPVLVGDGQPGRRVLLQRGDHGGGVGGVGHQEDLVVGDVVGDQVVDDPAGFGAAQRVLRLAGPDAAQVVGERRVDELGGARARTRRLAEVADVEQADGVAGGGVLADRAGIGHRHQPAAELGEARAELAVPILQGTLQQIVAHAEPP